MPFALLMDADSEGQNSGRHLRRPAPRAILPRMKQAAERDVVR